MVKENEDATLLKEAKGDIFCVGTDAPMLVAIWKEEKKDLIEIDSKYYETEKQSSSDLKDFKGKLNTELASIKDLIISNKNNDAVIALENFRSTIDEYCEVYSKSLSTRIHFNFSTLFWSFSLLQLRLLLVLNNDLQIFQIHSFYY